MNAFDENMKRRTGHEDCPVPEGFDARLNAALEALPGVTERPRRRHRPLRTALMAVGVAAALCVGAVAVGVFYLKEGPVGYLDGTGGRSLFSGEGYQRFNAAVGLSAEDHGLTVTLDNVAMDDTFLAIFYTVTGDAPLNLFPCDAQDVPDSVMAQWNSVRFRVEVDGVEQELGGRREAYLADASTLKGAYRVPLSGESGAAAAVKVSADYVIATNGHWDFETFRLDKTGADAQSLTAVPGVTFSGDDGAHTVERVSISPLGCGLTVSGGCGADFILLGPDGRELPVIRETSRTQSADGVFYEFTGGQAEWDSLTLVPYTWGHPDGPEVHEVRGAIDALPLTDDTGHGYTLERLDVSGGTVTAVFSGGYGGELFSPQISDLLDASGESLGLCREGVYADCTRESFHDRDAGLWYVSQTYIGLDKDAQGKLSQASGVVFYQNSDYTLLEDQTVAIPLK